MRLSKELRKSNRACEKMEQLVHSLTARLEELQTVSDSNTGNHAESNKGNHAETNKSSHAGSAGSNKENEQLAAENKALAQQRDHLLSRVAELQRSRAVTPSNTTAQESRGIQTEVDEEDDKSVRLP